LSATSTAVFETHVDVTAKFSKSARKGKSQKPNLELSLILSTSPDDGATDTAANKTTAVSLRNHHRRLATGGDVGRIDRCPDCISFRHGCDGRASSYFAREKTFADFNEQQFDPLETSITRQLWHCALRADVKGADVTPVGLDLPSKIEF
jgi:hypothetical protein